MPIHDWTRVDAGTFHGFHTAWMTHLSETLNSGLLPEDYYALPEQHLGRSIGDVLTLSVQEPHSPPPASSSVAVAEHPPQVSRTLVASPSSRATQRTLTIRHVSGHRIVALLEIVSPANKDRPSHVSDFVEKAISALNAGCHLLVVDLFPPGKHDPRGMNGAIWETAAGEDFDLPKDKPLTAASFVARDEPVAYVDFLAVAEELRPMPLFLDPDYYVQTPLQDTYDMAFRGLPAYWRKVLESN
jgi:hypothetical protein